MVTEQLSGRRDLVEGLDADAILDYLGQHGVLDSHSVETLRGISPVDQRNKALLQRVEREGGNAVALFINALRQSGQLHLASSLDNTQRIKPVSGAGYWEKQRHKGQVTITMEVRALRVVVPERDCDGDVIDASMLAWPHRTRDLDLSASRRVHESYENMVTLDSPDGVTRAVRIVDYPYGEEEEEEKEAGKTSFFCLCFPRVARKKKVKEKYTQRQHKHNTSSTGADNSSRDIAGSKVSTEGRVRSPECGRFEKRPSESHVTSAPFTGDARRNSASPRKDASGDEVEYKRSVKERKYQSGGWQDKENADPIIMEYNKNMELVRLKAQKHRGRTEVTSDSAAVVMCEKWKADGQCFRKKLSALCQQFQFDLQTYVIKYFEQDRGTLVLQAWTDGAAMFVTNICLSVQQVRQLEKDYTSGALLDKLDGLVRSNNCLEKLDIKDIDLAVVIDDDQFQQALGDLV